jgi:hypothetical protein
VSVEVFPDKLETVTETEPGKGEAGATAVIWDADTRVIEVAWLPPKTTLEEESKFAPVIWTLVPPATSPLAGEIEITNGGWLVPVSVSSPPSSLIGVITVVPSPPESIFEACKEWVE